jgi:hypothetical protein
MLKLTHIITKIYMIPDIHPVLMGPHALMSYESRMHALAEFQTHALMKQEEKRSVVKQWREKRELALQEI